MLLAGRVSVTGGTWAAPDSGLLVDDDARLSRHFKKLPGYKFLQVG